MNRIDDLCNDFSGEEDNMEAVLKKRRKLDFGKISFSGKTVSSEQALKEVIPMQWNQEVKNGTDKVSVCYSGTNDKRGQD